MSSDEGCMSSDLQRDSKGRSVIRLDPLKKLGFANAKKFVKICLTDDIGSTFTVPAGLVTNRAETTACHRAMGPGTH